MKQAQIRPIVNSVLKEIAGIRSPAPKLVERISLAVRSSSFGEMLELLQYRRVREPCAVTREIFRRVTDAQLHPEKTKSPDPAEGEPDPGSEVQQERYQRNDYVYSSNTPYTGCR